MKRYIKILAVCLLSLILVSCGGHTHEEINESVKKGESEYISDFKLEKSEVANTVQFSDSGVYVYFTKILYNDGVTSVAYSVKNSNDYAVTVVSDDASFNGFVCKNTLNIKVDAKDKALGTFDVGNDWFSDMGINRITDFELTLTVLDENNAEIVKSELLSIKTDALGEYMQEYETHGTELYSGNNIKILSRDMKKSDLSGDTEIVLYAENNSKETVTIVTSEVSVNEKPINATYVSTLTSGKKSVDSLLISENALSTNEIDKIEKISANFKAYNENFEIVFETGILNIPIEKAQ